MVGGPARGRVIVLLAAVLGLSAADTGAIGALAAPLERGFHIGNTQLGLLVAVTTLVGAVATFPFGVAADRSNRVRVLQVAVLAWGAATVVSATSVSYGMLLGTRVVLGLLVAAAGPLVVSLAGDLFPANERSRLFGLILTGELIGAGLGIVVAGVVSGYAGWRTALGILAVPAVVLAWGLGRYLPEPARGGQSVLRVGAEVIPATTEAPGGAPTPDDSRPPETEPSLVQAQAEAQGVTPAPGLDRPVLLPLGSVAAVRYVLRARTNLTFIVASGLGYFFLAGLETFAVLFIRGRYGIGQAAASVLFLLIALGAIAGVIIGGRIADRLIAAGVTNARPVVAAVGLVATAALFAPGLLTTTLAVSLPLFVLAGVTLGAVNPPLAAARLDVMPSALWGRAEAVRTALSTLLQSSAPLIVGAVSTAFGASSGGIGAGIDTARSATSARSGHALALTFLIMSTLLAVAGVVLAATRNRYLRDAVAAGRAPVENAGSS